jgi:hypothetical protein
MYQIAKDFASPVVTIIAACIAGWITFIFARLQVRIAKSQRDIALDKLKFDLFQKRYEIYQAAKHLIEHVTLVSDIKTSNPTKIRELYVTLDEARFYFPPAIIQLLTDLTNTCEHFFGVLAKREQMSVDDHSLWNATADDLAFDQAQLRDMYASLPKKFETALAFKQLTVSS